MLRILINYNWSNMYVYTWQFLSNLSTKAEYALKKKKKNLHAVFTFGMCNFITLNFILKNIEIYYIQGTKL